MNNAATPSTAASTAALSTSSNKFQFGTPTQTRRLPRPTTTTPPVIAAALNAGPRNNAPSKNSSTPSPANIPKNVSTVPPTPTPTLRATPPPGVKPPKEVLQAQWRPTPKNSSTPQSPTNIPKNVSAAPPTTPTPRATPPPGVKPPKEVLQAQWRPTPKNSSTNAAVSTPPPPPPSPVSSIPPPPSTPAGANNVIASFKEAVNAHNLQRIRKIYKTTRNSSLRGRLRYRVNPRTPESNLLNRANENIALRTANIPEIAGWGGPPTAEQINYVQEQLRLITRMITELGWAPDADRLAKLQAAKAAAEKLLQEQMSSASNNVKRAVSTNAEMRSAQIALGTNDAESASLLAAAKSALLDKPDVYEAYTNRMKAYVTAKNALIQAMMEYQTHVNNSNTLTGCRASLQSPCPMQMIAYYEESVRKLPSARATVESLYVKYKSAYTALTDKEFQGLKPPELIADPFSTFQAIGSLASSIARAPQLAKNALGALKRFSLQQTFKNAVGAFKRVTPNQARNVAKTAGKGVLDAAVGATGAAIEEAAGVPLIYTHKRKTKRRASRRRHRRN
jgi:hypothetical protein